jgi:hypothetical protein
MKKLTLIFSLAVFTATSFAATQGSVGTTSTGTFDISINIAPKVKISNLADVNFGTYSGSGDTDNSQDICAYSNTGGYQVTATGSGAANAFTITDGTDTIDYTLKWNDETGTSGNAALTTGTPLTGQSSSAPDSGCNSGSNLSANVLVHIEEAELLASNPSATVYSGTVTLLVEPE